MPEPMPPVGVNNGDEKYLSSLESMNEDEVIALAARGDTEAFSVLYQRYVNRIYNYIYYRTGNPFEAEDLTSRVFHRALNHIQRYDNRGIPFSAWLYRIAHNLVANWHRDSNRHREVPIEDQPRLVHHGEPPEHAVMNHQELERLMKVIRKLPAERQQLLILKFVEGLSNAEIAVIMMRSEGAIKSLYHRTLLALRNEIEKTEE
ncbi:MULTISPECIES: RNA polymerase sigma factor [Anaerolinea]|uniref:RNA polymerase sigma factor n=2 Tax=Anaerolineaceae TaxID=292628 RepID=UPI0026EB8CA2|nr:sigma-70 family RNA polymerase sigma factor [Anaerolinea thermophila]